MDMNTKTVIERCASAALAGTMAFPEILQQLASVGVERYHADYSRREITYYLASGESIAVPTPHPTHATGGPFNKSDVEQAVRSSQRNEHTYLDFIQKTMEAGCVGYFVLIDGKRVIYFGRTGDSHTEYFPGSHPDQPSSVHAQD